MAEIRGGAIPVATPRWVPVTEERLATVRPRSPGAMIWQQFRHSRGALTGVAILVLLVLAAVFAPAIAPFGLDEQTRESRTPPSADHPMGTDSLGRDILSRVVFGGRLSLTVGVISVVIGLSLGTLLGLLGGYYGRQVDAAVVMLTDVLLSFPSILLAMSIIAILGRGLGNVMIAVGIASIPAYVRLVRSSVLAAKNLPYVEAARVLGAGNARIMVRHLLPNVVGPVTVLATLSIATAILTAAGLSFLGLGAQPPTPEWGAMVSDGRQYLRSHWWIAAMPGFAIMLTVLAINLIGDGLRDALDPRLRH